MVRNVSATGLIPISPHLLAEVLLNQGQRLRFVPWLGPLELKLHPTIVGNIKRGRRWVKAGSSVRAPAQDTWNNSTRPCERDGSTVGICGHTCTRDSGDTKHQLVASASLARQGDQQANEELFLPVLCLSCSPVPETRGPVHGSLAPNSCQLPAQTGCADGASETKLSFAS